MKRVVQYTQTHTVCKSSLSHVTRELYSIKLICRNLYALFLHVKKPHTCPIHPNWVGSSGIRKGPTHRKSDPKRLRKKRWCVYRGCRVLADRLHRTRTDTTRLLFVSVRLSGSPIAGDLEKYTEVFTESVKCRRIDSIGHDPSLFVSVRTVRKSDRERLRKIHWGVYRGNEMLAELLHRTRSVFSSVYLTDSNSDL